MRFEDIAFVPIQAHGRRAMKFVDEVGIPLTACQQQGLACLARLILIVSAVGRFIMNVPFSSAFVVNHRSGIGIQIKEAQLR